MFMYIHLSICIFTYYHAIGNYSFFTINNRAKLIEFRYF